MRVSLEWGGDYPPFNGHRLTIPKAVPIDGARSMPEAMMLRLLKR